MNRNLRKRSITKTAKTFGIAAIKSGVTETATPNHNVVLRDFVFRKKEKMQKMRRIEK
jgi:hypothetical protein